LVNDINLKLYFQTVQPLEFIDTSGMDKEQKEEATGQKLSKEKTALEEFIDMGVDDLANYVEVADDDIDYDLEDRYISDLITPIKLSVKEKIINLISTGNATPNKDSKQDKEVKGNDFEVRYYYYGNTSPERDFCKAMMSAKKLYRKEDIIAMEHKPVNKGWGPKGSTDTYSIWKWKGGGSCHHSWRRKTFMNNKLIGTRAAEIRGFKVTNDWHVSVQPQSMPNKGFLPSNPQSK